MILLVLAKNAELILLIFAKYAILNHCEELIFEKEFILNLKTLIVLSLIKCKNINLPTSSYDNLEISDLRGSDKKAEINIEHCKI